MPLLRKIELKKWVDDPPQGWLRAGEFKADPLGDLAADDGRLSVWSISATCDLARITAALAANRNKVSNLEYCVIDDEALAAADFQLLKSKGVSPDSALNRACHFDIVDLSEQSLLRLSSLFRLRGDFQTRIFPALAEEIATGLRKGWMKPRGVKESIRRKLLELSLLSAAELELGES